MFCGISSDDYSRIVASGRAKEFARGEMIYIEGDSVQEVSLLTSGFVKITQLGARGAQVILRLSIPGDALGAQCLVSSGKYCSTAQAGQPCRALVWDVFAFKTLVQRFPVLHSNIARILTEHLVDIEQRFREVATERVGPRVARQVVRLQKTIGRQVRGGVEISLSREELAEMTGTTLFTVSRLLSAWAARGLVKPRREAVLICDLQSLHAISEEH